MPASAPRTEPIAPGLGLGWRILDAYVALILLAGVEFLVVALLSSAQWVAASEVLFGAMALLPIIAVGAGPLAVLLGGVAELVAQSRSSTTSRWVVLLLGALFGGALGWGLSGGAKAAQFAGYLIGGLALAGGLGAYLSAPFVGRLSSYPRRVVLPAAAGLIVLLELVNAYVFPRLYEAFHLGLAALTVIVAALTTLLLGLPRGRGPARRSTRQAVASLIVFAVSAAACPASATQLARLDNLRLVYFDRAPLLTWVVQSVDALSPEDAEDGVVAQPRAFGDALDLQSRDFVLITVDALRADRVGAYGYERGLTPNIDALAEEGVVFEHAYTPTPHTSYAVGSLMTGKYLRPLLLQGLGADSETWAQAARRYGYRTAAFYPPAVFFIDQERFTDFEESGLGFEYRKVEFTGAERRLAQVETFLSEVEPDVPLFLWVHFFEPHEPYDKHDGYDFGDSAPDRYDAEIAYTDHAVGRLVEMVRARRKDPVFWLTADHGEEFGEHGGRYHGTSVYEEQVRVPLVMHGHRLPQRRIATPVSLIDLFPTFLSSQLAPRPARVRGSDLGPLIAGQPDEGWPVAFAETETWAMVARDAHRLVCNRRVSACSLYDLARDPEQRRDASRELGLEREELDAALRGLEESHGRFEQAGLRAEGKGWPAALRRAIGGDGDAARDVGRLLEDADVEIRRKAAEVLFDLARGEAAPFLRLAVTRDEDADVRKWAGLALTRLGEGAGSTQELLKDPDLSWRRHAALALAEQGDDEGLFVLIRWLGEGCPKGEGKKGDDAPTFDRSKEIVIALGKLREEEAVPVLLRCLADVRLRAEVARALASIDEPAARPTLAGYLEREQQLPLQAALAEALASLDAGPELRVPLVRSLGSADPLPNALDLLDEVGMVRHGGGPKSRDVDRLRRLVGSGVAIGFLVPEIEGEKADEPLWFVCRARSTDGRAGEIRYGRSRDPVGGSKDKGFIPAVHPTLDPDRKKAIDVAGTSDFVEIRGPVPRDWGAESGMLLTLVVFGTQNVEIDHCVVVPAF